MAEAYSIKKLTETSWIMHTGGSPIAFIHEFKGKFIMMTMEEKTEFESLEEVKNSVGGRVSELIAMESDEGDSEILSHIDGFPVKHSNTTTETGGDRPVYRRGKTQHVAGYWCIKFSKRWVPSFCPLLKTIEQYQSMGPYKSRFEMMANLATLNR